MTDETGLHIIHPSILHELKQITDRLRDLENAVLIVQSLNAIRFELLDLRPGDVVIATIPNEIDAKQADEIKHYIQLRFPGHTVVVKPELVHLDFARDQQS